jgi:hypothetical protein
VRTACARVAGSVAAALIALAANLALAQQKPPPPPPPGPEGNRPVEAIARDLGVTPEQFREAFKKVTPAPKGQRPTPEQRAHNRKVLSEALGVSPEKLDEVMDKYRPEGPRH